MSIFEHIPKPGPNVTFAAIEAYRSDRSEKKVDLCPGIYYDEAGSTWVLPSVKLARAQLEADPCFNHDVQPQLGYPPFISAAHELVFGDVSKRRAITTIQTIAGTGANHFIAKFVSDVLRPQNVWFSNPTWENHSSIWSHVNPSIRQQNYPYYDFETSTLDIDGLLSTLRNYASRNDAIILHACAHNPTGLDPTREQWEAIAAVCDEKGIFPIFDMAYQGFATGDCDNDAWAVRHFATRAQGLTEFAVAQSFSKNMGLYGERVGALHIVSKDEDSAARVEGVLKKIHRAEITGAPSFGAKIAATILGADHLHSQWLTDLGTMSGRLKTMRQRLHDELTKREAPGNWAHLLTDVGMFSYTGLTERQVAALRDQFHVYALPTGRIAVTGLTCENVGYVADCFFNVLTTYT